LDDRWTIAHQENAFPGQVFLVRSDAGGYDRELGWSPESKAKVEPVPAGPPPEALDRDFESGPWQSIAEHTDEVLTELAEILESLPLDEAIRRTLFDAAVHHDWGKAHEVFQAGLPDGAPEDGVLWGKAPGKWKSYARRRFRHELASALAMIAADMDDLPVYLVAAHHGKVRLSIRSFPGEEPPPDDSTRLFARGVWDGDTLPQVALGNGIVAPTMKLSLECMQLGRSRDDQSSWTERMLKLRDDPKFGPFRLAYLEALLRAADMRASRNAARRTTPQEEVA
jgi:CRISPR-associated endonuclease/helicase Cas3